MEHVAIPKTPVLTSRIGFGCAGLMRVPSRRRRRDLLAAALDAGIVHFDVARMYGLGAAEGELGRFARGRRDRLTIATKFGIEPGAAGWLARLQSPARALVARYPALRRRAQRREAARRRARRYDPAVARASLEQSLRELGTDYVDVLFVHDPGDQDDVHFEGLRDFLDGAREAGRIRSWGVAGEAAGVARAAESFACDLVVQRRDDILSRPAIAQPAPQIAFGLLSSALGPILHHVRSSEPVRRRWRDATGLDCSEADVVTSLLLRDGLDANAGGLVLFSTTKGEHLAVAASSSEPDEPALHAFRQLVAADLGRRDAAAAPC